MIAAIVLAAGKSRRMGTQKLLLPWRGKPIIAHVVDQLLRSPVHQVLVVTGQDSEAIAEALQDRSVELVVNAARDSEMLDSVRCGLAAVQDEATGVLIALGDQPTISADIVAGMIAMFRQSSRGIVVPTYQDRRGHPLLVSLDYRDEILSGFSGVGLRALLHQHSEDIQDYEVDDVDVLSDIDDPEDYERAVAHGG